MHEQSATCVVFQWIVSSFLLTWFVAIKTGKTIEKVLHFGLTSFSLFYSVEWCLKNGNPVGRQLALITVVKSVFGCWNSKPVVYLEIGEDLCQKKSRRSRSS